MVDDSNSESTGKKFSLDLTASEIYALHGLLRYLSIEMGNKQEAIVSQTLAREVHEAMVKDDFSEAMEREYEEIMEMQSESAGVSPEVGFNRGGYQ